MTYLRSSVSHVLFVKVGTDDVGAALSRPQIGPDAADQFGLVDRTAAADGVGLDVLIQEFVRIQLRAVARKEEHPNLRRTAREPAGYRSGPVDRMTIHDEKNPTLHLAHQASEEAQKHVHRESFPEHHERQAPPVGPG